MKIQNCSQEIIESDSSRKQRKSGAEEIVRSGINNVKNIISIATDGTTRVAENFTSSYPASRRLLLNRGFYYGEEGNVLPDGITAFPLSGYFEFVNKSDDICCVKLLQPGGDIYYEVSKPAYYAGKYTSLKHIYILFDNNVMSKCLPLEHCMWNFIVHFILWSC